MKKTIITLVFFLSFYLGYTQNIGVGTNTPHLSSALDISDTSKGILIPRMTLSQRNNIFDPANGLLIYQTDNNKGFWYYDGTEWLNISNVNSLDKKSKTNQTLIYTTSGF